MVGKTKNSVEKLSCPYNAELARIAGDLTSDGHIQKSGWRYLISFYSNKFDEIEDINKRFKNAFGITGRIYSKKPKDRKNTQYSIFFISKPLTLFLIDAGIPYGNKVNQPFSVPDWICKGSKPVQAAYLKGIFSGEGSIYGSNQKNGKIRWQIGIEMYKWSKFQEEGKEFMVQLTQMFSNLGIKCSPVRFGRKNFRKDKSYSIAVKFEIESKEFDKFYKRVGFANKYKREKLLKVLAILKS